MKTIHNDSRRAFFTGLIDRLEKRDDEIKQRELTLRLPGLQVTSSLRAGGEVTSNVNPCQGSQVKPL